MRRSHPCAAQVCIFAYGQTGSGKTHTMEGPPDDRGVNFRAIEAVLQSANKRDSGMLYKLELSMLEIYNETIRDLLRKPGADAQKLDVATATGQSVVKGLDRKPVDSVDEIERLIAWGARNRTAGAHAMNKDSSRSHSIVTLYIQATSDRGDVLQSKLNLVDLAGSERLDKTGATGDRLTEAKFITKSLSALGDVIAALSSGKKTHVPFRNSKLTYLLQDSLAGALGRNASYDSSRLHNITRSLTRAARGHESGESESHSYQT